MPCSSSCSSAAVLNYHEHTENKISPHRITKDSNFRNLSNFARMFQIEKCWQISFVLDRLATDHQVRRGAGSPGFKRQLDRVELSAHFEAGTRQQMLETLAEQPVRFDQDGAGRGGHGGLSPKALVIERRRDPGWRGAARSRLR